MDGIKDVVLDDFDLYVDGLSGNAKEIIEDLYGDKVSLKTAESNIAGVRKHLERKKEYLKESGEFQYKKERYKFAEDGSKTIEKIIELSDSEMSNPSIIMEKMGLDPLQWELITCTLDRKAWQVTMKLKQDGVDTPRTETNYAYDCEVRVKPIQDMVSSDMIRDIFRELKPPKLSNNIKYHNDGCLLELPANDFHLGNETKISLTGQVQLYKRVVLEVLSRVEQYNIRLNLITFQIGQDFFHVDNVNRTTTAGTPQETSGDFYDIYREGLKCLLWAIEQLRHIAPVKVIYVPGNHDKTLSFTAALAAEAVYEMVDGVTVDTSKDERKYLLYGENLIGMAHGRDERKRIETLMQVEAPELWGKSKFREFHLGDKHQEKVYEKGGITFRRISALTEVNEWHREKGFIGAVKKAPAYIWDKKRGKILTLDIVANVQERI